jgi:AraC family transcriptional regulator, arabinose operon regulatory protein
MEDYTQIIDALSIHYVSARRVSILKPVTVQNSMDELNNLILVKRGSIRFGKQDEIVGPGEILFVPGSAVLPLTYGAGKAQFFTNDEINARKDKFFQPMAVQDDLEGFFAVSFETKAFDSVNFFASLDIPAFKVGRNDLLTYLIERISSEENEEIPGKGRLLNSLTETLIIELFRHIIRNNLFVEQIATNSTYFRDTRLIDLFEYIKDNLKQDLSNKVLANVANVSEDYVGQYFKMLTGINPQDYIEYQRMEMAVNLLRTTKKSIRDIGKEVGYKDTAYFCRRFKMMFGIPAGKMRRREKVMAGAV